MPFSVLSAESIKPVNLELAAFADEQHDALDALTALGLRRDTRQRLISFPIHQHLPKLNRFVSPEFRPLPLHELNKQGRIGKITALALIRQRLRPIAGAHRRNLTLNGRLDLCGQSGGGWMKILEVHSKTPPAAILRLDAALLPDAWRQWVGGDLPPQNQPAKQQAEDNKECRGIRACVHKRFLTCFLRD